MNYDEVLMSVYNIVVKDEREQAEKEGLYLMKARS